MSRRLEITSGSRASNRWRPWVADLGPVLHAPVHRPGLVRRSRLLRRLSETADRPLVVVAAPPGYGKTTALAQWAECSGRHVAWVTVEDGDNDPGRMLDRIGAALPTAAVASPVTHGGPPAGSSVWHLTERIRGHGAPVLLILDDLHLLRPTPVPDLLVQLAVGLPAGCQLAVVGRTVPPLRLGRLRAEGRCAEFGPADLAFDQTEAAEALAGADADVGSDEVAALVEATEGWPAGVYLAAVARREQLELAGPVGTISGDDAFISEYLREELLGRQPDDLARFLRRSAVLDQLSGPLCDAALATTGSAARLTGMERANLFVVPLDHRQDRYRYHRLFRQALLAELRRAEPAAERQVHARAAAWYEEHGDVERAVEHRIAGGDRPAAGVLVNRYGAGFIARGRIATVHRWVEALGPDALAAYPPVAVTAAWVFAIRDDPERARNLLDTAEAASFTGALPDEHTSLEGSVALLRAMMSPDGIERMLVDAEHAAGLAPSGNYWHLYAQTMVGVARLLGGSVDEAVTRFEQVALLARGEEWGPGLALSLAQLSLLDAARGDAGSAVRRATRAWDVVAGSGIGGGVTTVLTRLATASATLCSGDRESARSQLGAATRHYFDVPPTAFPWLAAQSALVLGELSLALDDLDAARTRLEDARRHLDRMPTRGVLPDRAQSLSDAIARAGSEVRDSSAMALTDAEDRVLRLLPTHLTLAEIADELFVSRNTVKTHVGAVYRKLQATTRGEAVTRAREVGLLAS